MTVKKVGRPSKVDERRATILLAMGFVVAQSGLANVTVAKIAEAAGLQRTLVLHYFHDRESLVDAYLDFVVGLYGDVQVTANATRAASTAQSIVPATSVLA